MINRGGQILETGSIGKVKILRQQILMPGETIKAKLAGKVQMESLRERDALRINAHVAAFMTPIRWVEPNWTDYVKGGPSTSKTISFVSTNPHIHGLGGNRPRSIQKYWLDAPLRIYNEWYKWPEDDDITSWPHADGPSATNLKHSWTRCRDTFEPDDNDDKILTDDISGSGLFNVRDLALIQARYSSALQKEVLSYDRYMAILKEMYGADGSREVDKVPIMLDQAEVGVDPRSIPATDAAGLGQWAALYDFNVDFGFTVSAPEHVILTYVLTTRFAPITEEVHPLANDRLDWAEQVGEPTILASMQPQKVQARDVVDSRSSTTFGYQPAGWQWRAQNNIIGRRMDIRDSFPVLVVPSTAAEARDGSRRVPAFRSQSMGDFRIDLYASESSHSAIPNALSSYYLGRGNAGKGDKSVYPKQGRIK